MRLGEDADWQRTQGLPELLRHLAEALDTPGVRVKVAHMLPLPAVFLEEGPVLSLPGVDRQWPLPVRGPLADLDREVRALAGLSGWWTRPHTLQLLMTGEPPLPIPDQLSDHTAQGRKRKALSVTHMALLQLMYQRPDEPWGRRARQWRVWRQTGALPQDTLHFDHSVTSEQWMRREAFRALDRARTFGAPLAALTARAIQQDARPPSNE